MGSRPFFTTAILLAANLVISLPVLGQGGGVVAWGFNFSGPNNVPPNLTNIVAVAAGSGIHSLALKADGTVVAWGDNTQGQCDVPAGLRAVSIAAGTYHSLALKVDGTVVAWGVYFVSGGGVIPAFVPPDLADVTAIAADGFHNLALKRDGTVVVWGSSAYASPAPEGLSNVVAIAAGSLQNLALKSDGTVVVWGYSFESYFPPADLSNVVAISASYYNFAALKADGSIALWGKNGYGQTTAPPSLTNNVTAIDAGLECYVALKSDGTMIAWGWNYFNQTNVPALEERVVGVSSGGGHTLALVQMGPAEIVQQPAGQSAYTGASATFRVGAFGSPPLSYQWFRNGSPIAIATNSTLTINPIRMTIGGSYQVTISNRFGVVASDTAMLTPVDSAPLLVIQPKSRAGYVGRSASFSVVADGSRPLRYQWRFNGANVIWETSSTLTLNPVATNQFGSYSVSISNAFGVVESTNVELYPGPVFAWGNNLSGQTNVPSDLDDVVMLAGGSSHTLALRGDGTVVAWGSGGFTESTIRSWVTNVASIAAGNQFSVVLFRDGTAKAWGNTTYWPDATNIAAIYARNGNCVVLSSNGMAFPWFSSVPFPSATNLTALAAGYTHTLGLRADGSLIGWGWGPVTPPTTAREFIDIAAGEYLSLALRGDGTVLAWGDNTVGQTNVPAAATNIVAISAGGRHALALRDDGRVFVWGDTNSGRVPVPAGLTFVTEIATGNDHNLALLGRGEIRFLRQPLTQTNRAGSRTLLGARAAGTGPVHYQWIRDGTNISGATNAYLTIPDTQEWHAGDYAIVISNSGGSITSIVAAVGVIPSAPVIERQPLSQQMHAGTTAVLDVVGTGSDPLRFQWQFNGADLPDATNRVLTIPNLRLAEGGDYQVIVMNFVGQTTSAVARLEVHPFEALPTLVATNAAGAMAWGDFDNDGLLDLLAANGTVTRTPLLFRNEGSGVFSKVNMAFGSPAAVSVAWGDFDNDDYLDIITFNHSSGGEIWHNNRNGTFTRVNSGLAVDYGATIALADFDNDGRLDVLIGGRLHRNLGGNRFQYMGDIFPVTESSSNAWGDYDNDGRVDLLLCGLMGGNARLLLYRNLGNGTFSNVNSGLPQIYRGDAAWLDFDADGNLDVVLSGETGGGTRLTELYKNNGDGTFSRVQSDLPATTYATIATGDYDNDGLVDVFLTGHNGISYYSGLFQGHRDGLFTPIYSPFPTNTPCAVACGDFNGDGRLDLALNMIWSEQVALYQNYFSAADTSPEPPLIASSPVSGINKVTFSWLAGQDAETPAPALTYNLRVGRSPGAGDIVSPDSDPNGTRRLPQPCNAGNLLYKTITGLGFGRYYWAVQTVDSAFVGSRFAPEQIFIYAVATLPASDVTSTAATLNGILDTNGLPATAWFRWGISTNYGNSTPLQTIQANSSNSFAAPIAGLLRGNTYHFELVISNADGLHLGGNQSFTTADLPQIVPQESSDISANSITINALVNANGATTGVLVEYGVTSGLNTITAPTIIGAQRDFVLASQTMTGLIGGQLYYYRIVATNDAGTVYASNLTFTTTSEPYVATLPPGDIGPTSAVLRAWVAPNTLSTHAFFEYGNTTNYGSFSISTNIGSGADPTTVSLPVQGLTRATVYQFRIVASNATGIARGGNVVFTTTNDVIALPPSNIGPFSATLHGLVNANGQQTTAAFDFGVTTNLESYGFPVVLHGTNLTPLSFNLTNLLADTTYFFRVTATNGEGARQSVILSFQTLPLFSGTNGGLVGAPVSAAWGDYDNDGRLDLLSGENFGTRIYRNLSNGTFAATGSVLPGIFSGSVVWGDCNNDGWLDILIVGALGPRTYIYRNNTNGSFTLVVSNLVGVSRGIGRWGDFNNDGLQDILIVGETNSQGVTKIYRNQGNESFIELSTSLPACLDAYATTVDYNNDGKLDILLMGRVGSELTNVFTKLFRNTGHGNFEDSGIVLAGVRLGFADCGDFDGDGLPDIVLGGRSAEQTDILRLYRNNGDGTFTDLSAGLPDLAPDAALWGDYDNDGRLDLLIRGQKSFPASVPAHSLSAVLRNNGNNTFTATYFQLPEIRFSAGGWADYTGDGRLDAFIGGRTRSGNTMRFYQNNWPGSNVPPDEPQQLSVIVSSNTATFAWNAATDPQSATTVLTYNLRVGRSSQSGDMISPLSALNGGRRIPAFGNVGYSTNFTLVNIPPGQYFWSVQAIDTAFAGSAFADEQIFVVPGPPVVATLGPTNVTANSATVRSAVISGVSQATVWFQWGTTTNFGNVTEAVTLPADFSLLPVSASISNLLAAGTYYYCVVATNLIGITFGETRVLQTVFSPVFNPRLSYVSPHLYQIEFFGASGAAHCISGSTNLIDWVDLGPAVDTGSNRFWFIDYTSTSCPVRFYRVISADHPQ
jgi:alpha-tubulin suppressor-like RCC1 family protein